MPIQFHTTGSLAQARGIKVVVYGPAGRGKTTLLGTAPAPFIIDAEAGLLPLRSLNIPAATVKDLAGVNEILAWLKSNNPHAAAIQTVCVDSISEIAEFVLREENKKGGDGRQIYGRVADKTLDLLREFRDLPKNVVLVAKEKAEKSEVTGVTKFVPSAPGNTIGPAIPYLTDEVFHAEVEELPNGQRNFWLRTWPDIMCDAKDRSGKLARFESPNLAEIFRKVQS